MGYAETYADYRPVKLRSGLAHPDMVVETASLSSVEPPDVRYNLCIPEEVGVLFSTSSPKRKWKCLLITKVIS